MCSLVCLLVLFVGCVLVWMSVIPLHRVLVCVCMCLIAWLCVCSFVRLGWLFARLCDCLFVVVCLFGTLLAYVCVA